MLGFFWKKVQHLIFAQNTFVEFYTLKADHTDRSKGRDVTKVARYRSLTFLILYLLTVGPDPYHTTPVGTTQGFSVPSVPVPA